MLWRKSDARDSVASRSEASGLAQQDLTGLDSSAALSVCELCFFYGTAHHSFVEAPNSTLIYHGDANQDGVLSLADAVAAAKAFINGAFDKNSDMNGDGKLTLVDIIRILKIAV